MRTTIIAVVLLASTAAWASSKGDAPENYGLPHNTLDCSHMRRDEHGNFIAKERHEMQIGTTGGVVLPEGPIVRGQHFSGGTDLADIVNLKCPRTGR